VPAKPPSTRSRLAVTTCPRREAPAPARGESRGPVRRVASAADAGGQAAVELVALLPLLALLLALAYQALLAGEAAWEAHVAARAAARANAVGRDAGWAARAHLSTALERGLRVRATRSGDVRVWLRIPPVIPALSLGRVGATAHFRPQDA
jgi:hypothetical protein